MVSEFVRIYGSLVSCDNEVNVSYCVRLFGLIFEIDWLRFVIYWWMFGYVWYLG